MKKSVCIVVLLLALVSVCPFARAVVPEVEEQLSKVKVLVVNINTRKKVWDLTTGQSDFQVVDLKLGPRNFATELSNVVANWVGEGNGVLLYLTYPREQASSECLIDYLPIEDAGQWARVKAEAYPYEEHPLLNGVRTVEVWTRNYISFSQSTEKGGTDMSQFKDWTPLLHCELGDEDRIYAMAAPIGSGRAVILVSNPSFPEYHGSVFDNERFLINIFQWLAGNDVPAEVLPLSK